MVPTRLLASGPAPWVLGRYRPNMRGAGDEQLLTDVLSFARERSTEVLAAWRCEFSGRETLVATFLLWPDRLRHLPFLLVALSALPCVVVALRRAAPGERLSWWLMLNALLLYNVGNHQECRAGQWLMTSPTMTAERCHPAVSRRA
jgi:hypothetical protein